MKNIFNDNKKTTIFLLVFIVVIIVVFFGGKYIGYTIQKNKKVVPYDWDSVGSGVRIDIPGVKPYNEVILKDDTNNTKTNKTEFEVLLEKYTFGDEQISTWLPELLNNKLSDKNKVYITIHNSSSIKKKTNKTCSEVFPNINMSENNKVEKDEYMGFCADNISNYYNYDELNSINKNLFGNSSNLPIINEMIVFSASTSYIPYLYSNTLNGYVELSCNCGGTFANGDKLYRIINTSKDDNKITIDIMYLQLVNHEGVLSFTTPVGNVYEYKNGSNSEDFNKMVDSIFENEKSLLKQYRFNFVKGSTDYYLTSIDNLN